MLRLFLAAVLLAALPAWAAAPGPVRPPIADFFDNPVFTAPVLSPDARYLAVRVATRGGHERLAVLDIEKNEAKVVAAFADADIGTIRWISDERIVFDTMDATTVPGERRQAPGLYAVNRDASLFRQLVARTPVVATDTGRPLLPYYTRLLPQAGQQNGDEIYVTLPKMRDAYNVDYVDLLRLNTITGRWSPVKREGSALSWMLDHQGEPRLTTSIEENRQVTQWRNPASGKWETIHKEALLGGSGFVPLGFAPDGTLYVRSNGSGDKAAIYRFDLATKTLDGEPVVAIDGYDFDGNLVTRGDTLVGVHYRAETKGTHWLDPKMEAIQKAVDARLPDTVNVITLARRPAKPVVLVTSYSDVQPTSFRLYDHAQDQLNKLGESHPAINPAQMGRQAVVRYQARDGMSIPAYVTMPAGAVRKNLPMVVLVHGGPYMRGAAWGWQPTAQFLASRGYVVLEPEFRGSTGYGDKHFRAGWKQWGLAMQDDIADGARWAIAQGLADPKRICIAGASYGGYATLMGLIKDPDLFKCGVAWVGVTDIKLLHTGHWSFESDASELSKKYGLPVLVGDLEKDAKQLEETSPLLQAARLKQPLMLAYGTADKRVPLYHGTQFRDAVKAGNANVDWIEYEGEGHGWSKPANRVDFWSRVEKFLGQHIGQ